MKAPIANLLNALTLILLGGWGYFGSDTPSNTALIPVVVGAILLACYSGVKSENKMIAHVAVLLTLLMILGLAMPFKGAIGRADTMAVIRVGLMIITGVLAMLAFIKSFKEARKARESA